MNLDPYQQNFCYCPHCDEIRNREQFEFVGLVPELGNIARYHCLVCDRTFELLPPSVILDDDEAGSGDERD